MKKIKFINKIRVRITGAMILCSLIMALLISIIGILTNYNFLKREIVGKLTLLPQNYSNSFNSDFKGIESSVNTLQHYTAATFDLKNFNKNPNEYIKQYEKMMDSIIKKIAKDANKAQGIHTTNGVEAVYFTFNPELTEDVHEIWYADAEKNGTLKKLNPDPDPADPYIEDFYPNNDEMRWYYDPIKEKKGVWSAPYEEVDLNIDIISYTEPVFKDDVLVGIVGMDINIDAMKNTIKNMKIYDTGYAFLMNNQYEFLIHPTFKTKDNLQSIENGNLKFMIEEIGKKNSGIIEYEFKGKKILGYSHLSNSWILGFTIPLNEVYSPLEKQLFLIIISTLLSICIITLISLHIGKSIAKPIVKITHLIKNTAKFNFTDNNSLKLLSQNTDEIGIMAKEMLNMQNILKETGVDKAAKLQRQSLQNEFPLPNKINMEVIYTPSKTVGGDFYHIEKINDHLVIGIIWDVSGKGVTAALYTYAFNVLFHESVLDNQTPAGIIHDLNIKVSDFLGETYIAACCFSFNFKNNETQVVGAGINQFIFQTNNHKCEERIVKGPFLGMFENSIFDEQIIHFKSGDRFYFFTDGLEFIFDNDKLKENYLKTNSITEFKNHLNIDLNAMYTDMEGLKDDCTMLALEIK
ncbi:SpoIIE family protein phosphatase [Clostridium ganghwense]|uniref:SpoIIE family protein phosphatase n=1 Tax=Clostridium ganghwense TaxID=312089 RepID=A0ABT4CP40_9CLOT|nr:SpoIIE family protein phosphatase [Clostridium ganghwense]MCY6370821.1 SpoIIE family protein phosphatase [Clostridium ganghwense]